MAVTATSTSIRTLPAGRTYFADERGVVLRATWHLDRGFVNLSIWQGDGCIATFQLGVADVARFTSFLVEGLAGAAAELVERTRGGRPAPPPPPSGPAGPGAASAPTTTTPAAVVSAVSDRLRSAWRGRRPGGATG